MYKELSSVLCSDLNGKAIQKWNDISMHIIDSLWCTAETNIAEQLYSNKNRFKNMTIQLYLQQWINGSPTCNIYVLEDIMLSKIFQLEEDNNFIITWYC